MNGGIMNNGIMKEAKRMFPTNIIVSLILGLIIGYFLATYVMGGTSGRAVEITSCTVGQTQCDGTAVQRCIQTPKGTTWLSPAPDCAKLGNFVCQAGKCVSP